MIDLQQDDSNPWSDWLQNERTTAGAPQQAAPSGSFGDADWDAFMRQTTGSGMAPGAWGPATPTPGSEAAQQGYFNAGSPGSLTALINQQNPSADPGKAYVQSGNTGGFLEGTGVTIGPGRSIRPADYVNMYNQAVEKHGAGTVQEWLSRNAWDVNRIDEALGSEYTGQGQGLSREQSGDGRMATTRPGQAWGGNWFDDPATQQLETLIKNQLNGLQNPAANSPQAQLMNFLNTRFQELAGSNGYSPQELAMLNTQGLEPIEALRKASQQRELERTARAGYMPTSGITRLNQQQNDLDYDRMRTQASRDLAVQNVNERTNRHNQALQVGQTMLGTERGTNAQALQLSTLLQQLPVQALQQAMSVLNGSSTPESLASIVAQMTAQNQNQQYYNQQQQQQLWANIGSVLADLF